MFQTLYKELGFVPEGANSWSFPKVMGKQRANALLLASDKLNTREMYDASLVTKVIEADALEMFREVFKIVRMTGAYSPESLRMAKAKVNRLSVLAQQREASMWEAVDLKVWLNSDEAKAAIKVFREKGRKTTESRNCR